MPSNVPALYQNGAIAWLPNSHGKDRLLENDLRRIAWMLDWDEQAQQYEKLSMVNKYERIADGVTPPCFHRKPI